jgi:HAMP domain-containing protein
MEVSLEPLFCTLPDNEAFLEAVNAPGAMAEATVTGQALQEFEWEDSDGDKYFAGKRHVFLRPQFFLPGLEVSVSESRASALSTMQTFGSAFWRVILMGLVAVALLSHIQIRKSLDPLEALQRGTKRVAEGEFRERVTIESKDEFEDLAESFNRMASDLESQFLALATVAEIDRAILSAMESDRIIETALHRVGDILPCDRVAVCRLDWLGAREGRLRVSDRTGSLGEERRVMLDSEDLSLLGEIHESDILSEADTVSQYFGLAPEEPRISASIMVPLRTQEGLAGYLSVGRMDGKPFSETDQARAQQIGKQISIALGNVWLLEELERMSWGALTALARTIDAKSPWTSGHSENVATFSVAIGRAMGLPEPTLTGLQRGGLIHDIGKIAVPGRILDKNGPLTPEEREVVQSHPDQGVRILEPVPGMEPILPMVLHHHEAWDGSGYPMGLAGESIPLEARIMAVADQFDALCSDRPYRPGRGVPGAVAYLREEAGKGLDPEIVDTFIDLLEAGSLPGIEAVSVEKRP